MAGNVHMQVGRNVLSRICQSIEYNFKCSVNMLIVKALPVISAARTLQGQGAGQVAMPTGQRGGVTDASLWQRG